MNEVAGCGISKGRVLQMKLVLLLPQIMLMNIHSKNNQWYLHQLVTMMIDTKVSAATAHFCDVLLKPPVSEPCLDPAF